MKFLKFSGMGSGSLACCLCLLVLSAGCLQETSGVPNKPVKKVVQPGPSDPDAPEEFTTTKSGLQYRILRKHTGKQPTPKSALTAHYRGTLDNGDIFDTTYGTNGQPAQLGMPGVVAGYHEGLLLTGEGGMIELKIPSNLAYGSLSPTPLVPPNSNLNFVIELIKVGDDLPDPPPVESGMEADSTNPGTPDAPGATNTEPGASDPDAQTEFTTTKSGLKYRILRKGDGKFPKANSGVRVHYKGWLDNGKVFDQSYSRRQVAQFMLSGVIQGWTEGLQYVDRGGMIELELPSKLGYGDQGQPPHIKGGDTLHFIVELINFR